MGDASVKIWRPGFAIRPGPKGPSGIPDGHIVVHVKTGAGVWTDRQTSVNDACLRLLRLRDGVAERYNA